MNQKQVGRTAREAVFEDLERSGIPLKTGKVAHYRFGEIKNKFIELFGQDVADLLIEELRKSLRSTVR